MCEEQGYLDLILKLLNKGETRIGRNGKTVSLFGERLEFNLKTGFPLLTTKKVFFKGVAEELFWFLRGSTNEKEHYFLDSVGLQHNLGAGYDQFFFGGKYGGGVDQIRFILEELSTNPHGRCALLNAWNPCQLSKTALPPYHFAYQFYINENGLSCQCNCRSQDLCDGTPSNIASTALLTHLIAHVLYLNVDRIIIVMGNVHIYEKECDNVNKQNDNIPNKKPDILILREAPPKESSIDEKLKWLETLKYDDILIEDYYHY